MLTPVGRMNDARETERTRTKPIGQGGTTRHNTSLDLRLSRDVSGRRDDDLIGRPNLTTHELNLVSDEEPEVLDILPLAPTS